jgi:branched-chain amino acid transport system permease protein
VNSFAAAGVYALAAIGFGIIYRTTGFFNFAHGVIVTIAPYLLISLLHGIGVPVVISFALAILISAAAGGAMELVVFGPLRRSGAPELSLMLASIGLLTVCQNVISAIFGDSTTALRLGIFGGNLDVFGASITVVRLVIVSAAIALTISVALMLRETRMGNAILAIGANRYLAECLGIDSRYVTLQTFVLGSALAAVAGILIAVDADVTPSMGYQAMLNAIAAVIIGGRKSPFGWIIGAILVGTCQNLGVWKIGSHWQDTITFALVLIFISLRPRGIFPSAETRQ